MLEIQAIFLFFSLYKIKKSKQHRFKLSFQLSFQGFFFFWQKLKGEKISLNGARGEATLWDYLQEHLVVIKGESSVKFEIILLLLWFLSEALTNKHCRTWSSMINLWINGNRYFLACENFPNFSWKFAKCHFWMKKSVFLKILHQHLFPR